MKKQQTVSSMPSKPVYKAKRFTDKMMKKLHGRSITVGWEDSPATFGIAIYDGNSLNMLEFDDHGKVQMGLTRIDEPKQIIEVGNETQFQKFSVEIGI